jgi:hypothetical protein
MEQVSAPSLIMPVTSKEPLAVPVGTWTSTQTSGDWATKETDALLPPWMFEIVGDAAQYPWPPKSMAKSTADAFGWVAVAERRRGRAEPQTRGGPPEELLQPAAARREKRRRQRRSEKRRGERRNVRRGDRRKGPRGERRKGNGRELEWRQRKARCRNRRRNTRGSSLRWSWSG